jgi:hypothetical protein
MAYQKLNHLCITPKQTDAIKLALKSRINACTKEVERQYLRYLLKKIELQTPENKVKPWHRSSTK